MDLFQEERSDSIKVLKLLYKNLLFIVIFSFLGLVLGIVTTLFMPKKYMSYGVIFPANTNLGLSVLEDPRFGTSLDADQLMQMLESNDLRDTLIDLYKLDEYYEVDRTDKTWKQRLEKKFFKDISITKTRYYSIVIIAKMKDPELASNIVNSMIEIVDILRSRIIRQNQFTAFQYAKDQYFKQKTLLDSLKKRIYEKKELSDPNDLLYNHGLEKLKSDFYNSSPFVTDLDLENLIEEYNFEKEKLDGLKIDFHKAKRLMEKPVSKVYIVSRATPSYKKISPSFLINAVIGLFSALLFSVLFVLVRDRAKSVFKLLKS